jgi:hypothetical protein
VWNRIPDQVRERIVTLALDQSALSPRELAVSFTDAERYFVSEHFAHFITSGEYRGYDDLLLAIRHYDMSAITRRGVV